MAAEDEGRTEEASEYRIEKERKLKQLVNEDTRPGRTYVKQLAKQAADKTLKTVTSGATLYALKVLIDKGKINPSEAAQYITPNPSKKRK